LAEAQQPAGAAGGGVHGLARDIHQDGAEGGPLGLGSPARVRVEGGGEEVLMPAHHGAGEGVELADGQGFGGGEEGAERLDHCRMGAEALAGGAGERGDRSGTR